MSEKINNNLTIENTSTEDGNKISNKWPITSEKDYKSKKAYLKNLEKMIDMVPLLGFIAFLTVIVVLVFCPVDFSFSLNNFLEKSVYAAICALAAGVTLFVQLNMNKIKVESRIKEYEYIYLQQDINEDIFENSIKMSYKFLNQYYDQTREQAQRGFYVTLGVCCFGALLVFIGIVAMFFEKTNPAYITCASGVITEFISAIFFYLYNKTVSSMSNYHNKLVLSHNISVALKIADSMPDGNKENSKNLIITELLKDMNNHLIQDNSNNH